MLILACIIYVNTHTHTHTGQGGHGSALRHVESPTQVNKQRAEQPILLHFCSPGNLLFGMLVKLFRGPFINGFVL